MGRCAVKDCKNYQGKRLMENIRFFKFPREKNLENEWVKACGKKLGTRVESLRICSVHFSEEDYRLQDILLNTENKKLKPGAVPTKYLENTCDEENDNITDSFMSTKAVQTDFDPDYSKEIEIIRLRKEIVNLKKEIKRLKKKEAEDNKLEFSVRDMFIKGQIKRIKNETNFAGPSFYNLLRNRFYPLPSASCLGVKNELNSVKQERST